VLNVVDDHCRLCPGQIIDVSISGARVARFLDELALEFGLPVEIVLDNGPEGTSGAMLERSGRTGVRLGLIEPGKPVQNAYIESFNGKFREECLNLHWFRSQQPARDEIGRWRDLYNTVPTLGARIPVTHRVPDDHHRDSARDSCGLGAAAQHSNPTGRFQIKPALIQGEGQTPAHSTAAAS
jgi:transposase InsO family protein